MRRRFNYVPFLLEMIHVTGNSGEMVQLINSAKDRKAAKRSSSSSKSSAAKK